MLRFLLASAPFLVPLAHDLRSESSTGERLRTTYTVVSDAALVGGNYRVDHDGEVTDIELPATRLAIETKAQHVFLDEVARARDGARERFVRTYEALAQDDVKTSHEGVSTEDSLDAELEGHAVAFERNGDGWSAHWAGEGPHPDDAVLEHLEVDLSFAAFLPPNAVEVGATWEPQAAALAPLESPAGSQFLMGDFSDPEETYRERRASAKLESLVCRLAAVEDGRARITFQARGCEERWPGESSELEEQGLVFDVTREHIASRDLDGELVWDLAAGRLVSLKVEAETVGELVERRVAQGLNLTVVRTLEFEGKDVFTVRVEDA